MKKKCKSKLMNIVCDLMIIKKEIILFIIYKLYFIFCINKVHFFL